MIKNSLKKAKQESYSEDSSERVSGNKCKFFINIEHLQNTKTKNLQIL